MKPTDKLSQLIIIMRKCIMTDVAQELFTDGWNNIPHQIVFHTK